MSTILIRTRRLDQHRHHAESHEPYTKPRQAPKAGRAEGRAAVAEHELRHAKRTERPCEPSLDEGFLRPVLVVVVVLAVVGLGFGLSATDVIMLQASGIALSAILQHFAIARPFARKFEDVDARYQVRQWLRVAIPILLIGSPVGHWIDMNIVAAGAYLPSEQLALYNAVLRTVAVVNLGLAAVNTVIAPRIAEAYAQGDIAKLATLTRRCTALMFWPALAALAGLALVGDFVLVLFDESFVVGHDALQIALRRTFGFWADPISPVFARIASALRPSPQ